MTRKLLMALLIALAALVPCLGEANYTIIPWSYGAVVWVQTPPENARAMASYATKAVTTVFSFWSVTAPVPAANWAHPIQTSSQAWYQPAMKRIQSPSTSIAAFLRTGQSFVRGTPVPESNSDELLILSAPSWNGRRIPPLIIGVYPDRESMNAACRDYSFIGIYGPPFSFHELMLEKPTAPSASLIPIIASGSDITLTRTDDWQFTLDHELAHWLTDLVCRYEGTDFGSLPGVIREGIADYTAYSLAGDDHCWQNIAAEWVRAEGNLDGVSPPLWYDVGTSLVSYLVERTGKEGVMHLLPAFVADWAKQAAAIAPGWQASLHGVKLTDGDRALYEARLERLGLCAWMLAPVLPPTAGALVDRLYTGEGTLSDIDAFWKVVSVVPPVPSPRVWSQLARRENTFHWVQYQDGAHNGERMARARVEVALSKYREAGDWSNYYTWFITGLRTVIAAWGNPPEGC